MGNSLNIRNSINSITLSFFLSFFAILSSVNAICNRLIARGFKWDTVLIYLLFFGLIVYQFVFVKKSIKADSFLLWIGFIILILISSVFFKENIRYVVEKGSGVLSSRLLAFLFLSLIGYNLSREISDIEEFLKVFEFFSIISILMSAIYYFIGIESENGAPQYMTFSYNILLQVSFMVILSIQHYKLYRLLLAVLGTILIFVAGCRGALVALFISVMVYLLFYLKMTAAKKFFLFLTLTIVAIVFFVNFIEIMKAIEAFLNSINIDSRTITSIINGEFFYDSGRSSLRELVINNLNLFGHGLWGDRVLLNGRYVHNLFWEIMYDFGFVFGLLIIFALSIIIIKAFKVKDKSFKIILCALLSTGIIKLFFSGSFLSQEPSLYVFLGMCTNVIIRKEQLMCKEGNFSVGNNTIIK